MEFHFRASAGRLETHSSSSSKITSLSEQAFPAYLLSSPTQNPELTPREVLQRLIEKERIKTEIVAGEVSRRPGLGAEVTRELIHIIEEEEAMRGMSFEERLAMRLKSKLSMPPDLQPQLRWSPFLEAPAEVKPAAKDNKDKLTMLAKPDSNLCGAKRKAAPPAGDSSELPFACLFKKRKEEWSCALCQVSATSEKAFKGHLRGKKHLIKEAGLRNQTVAKNYVAAPLPEKIGTRKKLEFWCEICEIGASSAVVMETHKKGKKHLARLRGHAQNGKAIPSITTMEVSDGGEESKNLAGMSEEADKKTAENDAVEEKTAKNNAIEEKTAENVVGDVDEPRLPPAVNDQV